MAAITPSTMVKSLLSRVLTPQFISRVKVFALRRRWLRRVSRLRYFGLNALDQTLEQYLDVENGYFVELGANDGVNQSNTLYFEWFRGWRGLLIEPYAENFKELIRNRSQQNVFRNVACIGPEFSGNSVQLVYSNLMTSALGVNSDIGDANQHANEGARFWGGKTFSFEAPAATLNQLLIEALAPTLIDLLSFDVEGAELEVLKGVDHSKFRFRYLCVESRSITEVQSFLENHQYQLAARLSPHDYLFSNLT